MMYFAVMVQNLAALVGFVYLIMNDHPWWAVVCILFMVGTRKVE